MNVKRWRVLVWCCLFHTAEWSPANPPPAKAPGPEAKTAFLKPGDLAGFDELPAATAALLRYALSLTERNLAYKPGSADPETGGTDCSGFVYHVLREHGWSNVPRQADQMYAWTWQARTFRACNGTTMDTFEFRELKPGDLLFWVNSTREGKTDRNPPVTHVMIYAGKRRADGRPVAIGASDGRSFNGERMNGVSVFDFRLPRAGSNARFIGYAGLPDARPGGNKSPKPNPPKPLRGGSSIDRRRSSAKRFVSFTRIPTTIPLTTWHSPSAAKPLNSNSRRSGPAVLNTSR